jgi:hypothetical protein
VGVGVCVWGWSVMERRGKSSPKKLLFGERATVTSPLRQQQGEMLTAGNISGV